MPTSFPGAIDNFTNPSAADNLNTPAVLHSDQHSNENDAIEALEAKVGIDGSLVTGTLDFRVASLEGQSSHSPVTLGIANGLVLSGQQLSMGLAGASSTGTLSAADWNTFNSKQSALSFPLASSLGGTSVSNTGTFTNHSNTTVVGGGTLSLGGFVLTVGASITITGGGTIALGGFTLTVPATGTVDLLGTAQTITATKTFTAAQIIDGTANAIQLRVQGHSTNTAKLQTWEDSTGTVNAAISNTGEAGFGGYEGDSSAALMSTKIASAASQRSGQFLMISGASNRVGIGGVVGILRLTSAITHTGTGGNSMFALGGQLQIQSAAATTAEAQIVRSMASISIGTLTLLNHFVINDIVVTGSGVVTAQNGIYVYDLVNAATNYAVYTNAGLVRFGDIVNTTESYQVDGTQVVTNRVIDARIDDAISSGDATTDGVIDAIRDALITHGLIAAA